MRTSIRDATPEDAPAVSEVVHASFREYIAKDWQPQACENLLLETTTDKLAARIMESPIVLLCEGEARVVGVILLPRPNLIQLCFVAPGHTGQGIGRALWEAARSQVEGRFPDTKTIELNASPYAVPAYKALGFYPISEPFIREGAVATRMACWLPARALASAQSAA